MQKIETALPGVCILEPKIFQDERGLFIKTFNQTIFDELGLPFSLAESYYSTSQKNVIRGMHFQTPPAAHVKLVYVTSGSITDVVVDIRRGSPTYGQSITIDLSATNRRLVYIPVGCAHGFLSLEDESCVVYCQSTGYAPESDAGIRYDSFGFDWGVADPIMSARDQAFPTLADFETPFHYDGGMQ